MRRRRRTSWASGSGKASRRGKGGDAWKANDNTAYLVAAVATRGGTAQVSQNFVFVLFRSIWRGAELRFAARRFQHE
ncbi:hypothetical protein FIBSPDRAFT_153272 [Athelia psychrophila]|uniref:Uncharacterized protein n=1 Tax=Athelia psychrophila TaxID=1759441 RepID=A0A166BHK8_9AGAM|nr:hypothetical protein FIBSPDRAFT_153272 [Fibularhizoctonia sp. CBS 109695]